MNTIVEFASMATVTMDIGTDGDGSNWLSMLFLLSGPAYYFFMYSRYRNQNKRHHHEAETLAETANLQASDNRVKRVTGVSNSRIRGDNARDVSGARN
ncbi:hypothetical protein [Jonesia quinghaiensis]|uniref:hypothetical protein n=1 Tax=Jonesia quinghaiensis TaxID=262806 RepID=UPI00041D78F0|nr:hypothetical protein [Jonesia quinghaiensis]